MDALLSVSGLKKSYAKRPVLADFSLSLFPGEIFGLAGKCGSGKSTLLKLLSGISFPDAGTAHLSGEDLFEKSGAARKKLGVLTEKSTLIPHLTGRENWEWSRFLRGLSADFPAEEAGLGKDLDRPVSSYSFGMKKRLEIAMAKTGGAAVLLLDEPFAGLDAAGKKWLREALCDLARAGGAVLFSGHEWHEMECICNRVGFLRGGKIEKILTPTRPPEWDSPLEKEFLTLWGGEAEE